MDFGIRIGGHPAYNFSKLGVSPWTGMEKRVLQSELLRMQVACSKDIWETDAKICIQTKLLFKNSLKISGLSEHTFGKSDVGGHKVGEVFVPR